jgi:translation initiation factor IF-3
MLIGSNGEKQGLVAFSVALESAREASLDLVQVSPSGLRSNCLQAYGLW